jgi:hypothetical protein
MTSTPSTQPRITRATAAEHRLPVRLRLKPPGPTTGFVDGEWWPRSRDLAAELKTLLPAVTARLGLVERVSYHLSDWDTTVRKIDVDGLLVRLGGYRSQHPNTVDLVIARHVFTLLVVPSHASPDFARRALTAAAEADNTDRIEKLLEPALTPRIVRTVNGDPPAAEQRWETEGGHLRQRGDGSLGSRLGSVVPASRSDVPMAQANGTLVLAPGRTTLPARILIPPHTGVSE